MSSEPPAEDRPVGDLLGMRELFQEEARTILDRLRVRLPEVARQLPDATGLADVVADGVAIKGSGALVGLPVVSRAGLLVVRAAELAAARARNDVPAATVTAEALRTSVGALEKLLDGCLDSEDDAQEALLAEALARFAPGDRSILRHALEGETASPSVHTRSEPVEAGLRREAVAGLVEPLTDLLIAETQLGGIEREIDALLGSLRRDEGEDATVVREVVSTLAGRTAPALALARAAAELHRRLRELDTDTTPIESLVVLHVNGGCYALLARDVESVVPVADVAVADAIGRTTLSLDGAEMPALDLGRYLESATSRPALLAVIAHADDARFALLVERAEAPHVMVLRPLDALLANHPLAGAATVGARGEVVLVLRPGALRDAVLGVGDGSRDLAEPSIRS